MLLHSQQHRTRLDLDKAAAHASPPPGENRMSKMRCFCVRRDVQLWTCDHCLRAYKAWLCSSLFLRCNGASVDDGVTKPCLDMCWTVSRRSVLSYLACCVTADQKLDRMLPACLKTVADTCVPVCTLGAGPRLKTGTGRAAAIELAGTHSTCLRHFQPCLCIQQGLVPAAGLPPALPSMMT